MYRLQVKISAALGNLMITVPCRCLRMNENPLYNSCIRHGS